MYRNGQHHLRPTADYGQLSPDMWNFLHSIYGGGPEAVIRQRALSSSQSSTTVSSSPSPLSKGWSREGIPSVLCVCVCVGGGVGWDGGFNIWFGIRNTEKWERTSKGLTTVVKKYTYSFKREHYFGLTWRLFIYKKKKRRKRNHKICFKECKCVQNYELFIQELLDFRKQQAVVLCLHTFIEHKKLMPLQLTQDLDLKTLSSCCQIPWPQAAPRHRPTPPPPSVPPPPLLSTPHPQWVAAM